MGIVLKDILAVLPAGDKDEVKETTIYIEGNRIEAIGEKPQGFHEEKVIDGKDRLVIPGLINCHTHSYMAFMRNVADDLSFMDWLFGTIDPIEQQMTDEDTYWGACLAIIEMMKSGTTCFNDMQMNIHQTTRAVKESGMRAVICRGLVGSGNDEAGQMRLRQAYEERDGAKDCGRLSFMLGPHAPYTCDDGFMRIVSEEAKKNNMRIHVHLSESVSEIQQIQEKYGCTPIEMADKNGLFDVPAIAAHCVQVTDSDIDIGQYAHGNEPSHHIIHLYNYAGRPERTQELIDQVLKEQYRADTDGLSGNEDCGQMSAWYILNSLGFYQVCPGVPVYSIGRPWFPHAVVNLPGGKKIEIKVNNYSKDNKYIKSVKLNGKTLDRPFFNHSDIANGAIFEYDMSATPA